jgi:hypothetical protein
MPNVYTRSDAPRVWAREDACPPGYPSRDSWHLPRQEARLMTATPADLLDPSASLAKADQLLADGQPREAIDLLSAANRRARDTRVEQRLVQVRHTGFASIDRLPGRDNWPPDTADLFPVGGHPPEIAGFELTAEALGSGILRHGCLLVRGLVPRSRVAPLVEATDKAMEFYDAHCDGVPVSETAPWFVPFAPDAGYSVRYGRQWVRDAGGAWLVDSPRALFELTETLHHAGVDRALTGYLGERPALSVKKCTLRRVPPDTRADWHQDGAFLGAGIRTVNVWLSLSHCGDYAPGLDIVPRRFDHIVETGTHGAQFDWSVGPDLVEQVAADAKVVRPIFEPGDALLFDDFFLHQTGVSPGMTHERYAIESWFFAPSTYPDDQIPILF